jgi:hypothetical protein
MMEGQTRLILEQNALTSAHSVSRLEAERDFPDVYGDPELRAAAETILARDPRFSQDRQGPYLAAALARGLATRSISGSSPQGGMPAAARKEALAGVGASVPEGSGAPDDRQARYDQAMTRARATGKEEDAAFARLIQQGLA